MIKINRSVNSIHTKAIQSLASSAMTSPELQQNNRWAPTRSVVTVYCIFLRNHNLILNPTRIKLKNRTIMHLKQCAKRVTRIKKDQKRIITTYMQVCITNYISPACNPSLSHLFLRSRNHLAEMFLAAQPESDLMRALYLFEGRGHFLQQQQQQQYLTWTPNMVIRVILKKGDTFYNSSFWVSIIHF